MHFRLQSAKARVSICISANGILFDPSLGMEAVAFDHVTDILTAVVAANASVYVLVCSRGGVRTILPALN